MNLNSLKLTYYSLVYPYLIYGNLIWGNTYKNRLQKMVTIQKNIVRLVKFKSYFEHGIPIFNELKILELQKINLYLTSLFMFGYFNLQNLPEMFENYFSKNNYFHAYNTRSSLLMHKKYKRTNYTKHFLSCKGIDVWNSFKN